MKLLQLCHSANPESQEINVALDGRNLTAILQKSFNKRPEERHRSITNYHLKFFSKIYGAVNPVHFRDQAARIENNARWMQSDFICPKYSVFTKEGIMFFDFLNTISIYFGGKIQKRLRFFLCKTSRLQVLRKFLGGSTIIEFQHISCSILAALPKSPRLQAWK